MFGPCAPIDTAKHCKAIWRSRLELVEMAVHYFFAPAAIQVHKKAHVGFVQHVEQFRQRPLIPPAAERLREVIVSINHVETRQRDLSLFNLQARMRLKLAKV